MNATLLLDRNGKRLRRGDGRAFDAAALAWVEESGKLPAAETIAPAQALDWLVREAHVAWRVPVGVVGPGEVDPPRYELAEVVGHGLAAWRVPVLCGGRGGVMEAACRGATRAKGLAIGLLPGADPALANPYASLVLATGIGEARNALIARASVCLVAIGDSYGTLSEVALGRQFGKRVIGLAGAANVEGVEHVDDAASALARVAEVLLGL